MPPNALNEWLETPRGRYLLAWEAHRIDLLVANIFGFHALQIGMGGVDLLSANRISCRLYCAEDREETGASLYAIGEELPFASQSIDLVVLAHVLEFSDHPHQILREIERVLVPEGHVLIAGFNPFSFWGIRRAFSGNLGDMPWQGQYISLARLKDWLSLLSFEHRQTDFGCFAPPFASEVWLGRWSFMDALGAKFWPVAGGAYILQAVKRTPGMRLITPKWRSAKQRKAMVPVGHHSTEHQWNNQQSSRKATPTKL